MSFLTCETIDAAGVLPSDVMTRFWNGGLEALVIQNVFTERECEALKEALETNRPDFPVTHFPGPFRSYFLGANLNLAEPDLAGYFAAAPRFDAAVSRLMAPFGGVEARVFAILSRLDGGRSYIAPPRLDDARGYMVTTFRAHLPGGFIPLHFDNEQARRPGFRFLLPLIKGNLASFVLTLNRADGGGVLEVADAQSDRFGTMFTNQDGGVRPPLDAVPRMRFDVENGTMVILRSGHYLHQLTPVEGNNTRWTACSFMAQSADNHAILCWG